MNTPTEKQPKPAIILFGGGQQSMAIAKWFGQRLKDLLIVTTNVTEKNKMEKKGFNVTIIEHTDDASLQAIGIGQWVDTIFCMFTEDAQNVFVTLSARALSPNLSILCLADTQGTGQKLLAAGATKVIDPHEITGNRINDIIRHPLMVQTLEQTILGNANLNLSEIEIKPDSSLKGKYLSEVKLDCYNLLLLGIVDQDLSSNLLFNTTRLNHQLDSGDYLVVIGPAEEIQRFRKELNLD